MKSRIISGYEAKCFISEIHKWMKNFALSEWNYEIAHRQIGDGRLASANIDFKGKLVLFEITHCVEGDWGMDTSMESLALHEVIHVLLADFAREIQRTQSDSGETVAAHEHAIIHRLTRVLLGE